MRGSKLFLYISSVTYSLFFCCLAYVIFSLFQTIDQGGGKISDESRLSPAVSQIQDDLKKAKSADECKKAFKSLDLISGVTGSKGIAEQIKKNYSDVLMHFNEKNKDFDYKNILVKKRDFLDNTINFYRKEVPGGDIRVRSVLLNIVFDTNSSFTSDSLEMEMAFSKRTREKINSLKTLAAQNKEAGVAYRAAMLDAAFGQYERANSLLWSWSNRRDELVAQAEKLSEKIVFGLKKSADANLDFSRRNFLYALMVSCMIVLLCAAILYFGYQYFVASQEKKRNVFMKYVRSFSQDKLDPGLQKDLKILLNDDDWSGIITAIQEAEDQFILATQIQICLSKNLSTAYFLFGKDGSLLLCNSSAQQLLDLTDNEVSKYTRDAFLSAKVFEKSGEEDGGLDYVRSFCRETSSGMIETILKRGEEKIPVELLISHISQGSLVGGKIILIREIRNEMDRITREVNKQISYAQEIIHKVAHDYELSDGAKDLSQYSQPVMNMIDNLRKMKMRVQERELLWQNEVKALLDQIVRQKEIFSKFSEELLAVQLQQKTLHQIMATLYDAEETISDEIIQIEMNLQQWMENRRRLYADISHHSTLTDRVKNFEESVRESVHELRELIQSFNKDFVELQQFKEEARLRAVNLAIGIEQGNREEYASKARSYAAELSKFCDRMRLIQEQVQRLVAKHPGGSLFAQLSVQSLDAELVTQVKDEHIKLSAYLQRWKIAGVHMLDEGEKAKEILSDIDKKSGSLNQLTETCQLINNQAQENLQRWN